MNNSIFMGYPSQPHSLPEVHRAVAKRAPSGHIYVTWESLQVGGTVVISTVLDAIEDASFCLFDVTRPNPNVLFEAGFAIARGKPIWLTVDTTVASYKKSWNDLAILKEIGYTPYQNSGDLIARINSMDPLDTVAPLYDTLIEPAIPYASDRTSLLYCPPYAPYEASNQLSSLVNDFRRRGLQVVVADPQESSLNQLRWYAPKLASAAGILINFAGADRTWSEPHNCRNAFVAGMAVGLEINLLMVSEGDYTRPFDYESKLGVYSTAAQCLRLARPWLESLDVESVRIPRTTAVPQSKLLSVRLGEHVAENESSDLAAYFVETAAYRDVVTARDTLFVGHRGTGKTANALQAFEEISANRENLAVLIKPPGFEFPGLLAAVDALPAYTHDYLFDTLWRFLIQTEICAAVLATIDQRPAFIPNDPGEDALLEYVDTAPFDVRADIAARLDQALQHLRSRLPELVGVDSGRVLINEAFHEGALAELRQRLGLVLKGKRRVAVFVDNLDKGWERTARLDTLARLILGLLTAKGRVVVDFNKQDWWRDKVKLTIAIFLRSDIFGYLKKEAREPDKLSTSTIVWRDPETLISVLQARIERTWSGRGPCPKLWGDIFPTEVDGTRTQEFLTNAVLPRPRDLVYLCNSAIARAIDRRHDSVLPDDLRAAIETYSQYAYEALLVEDGITIPEMEAVLFSFLGSTSIVTGAELITRMQAAGLPPERHTVVVGRLIETSFLGLETKPCLFLYPEIGADLDRALALSELVEPNWATRRYRVHEAFHRFLEISDERLGN